MCKMTKTQRLELKGRGRLLSAMRIDSQSTATSGPEQDANSVVVNRLLSIYGLSSQLEQSPGSQLVFCEDETASVMIQLYNIQVDI